MAGFNNSNSVYKAWQLLLKETYNQIMLTIDKKKLNITGFPLDVQFLDLFPPKLFR